MGIMAYLPDEPQQFIASWKGFRNFTDALAHLGAGHFPAILDQLPDGDEGETAPDQAATMLAEIAYFEANLPRLTQVVLVDSERGDDISTGSDILGGTLTIDRQSGFDLGFDDRGFFVRDRWDMGRDLFRALRVTQRLIHPEAHTVEYVDRDSEQVFQCSAPFGKPITGADGLPRMFLRDFHIETRPMDEGRFAYILNPLKDVLQKSVERGHPIRWG